MQRKRSESNTLSREIIKTIAQTASDVALKRYKEEYNKDKEVQRDNRLYNTRLLLERYKGLVEYSEEAVSDAMQIDDDDILEELLELMNRGKSSSILSVESIQERAARTRIIVDHINKMLEFYRFHCESSSKNEVLRKWETIYYMYLGDITMNALEIAEKIGVEERSVYRYQKSAIQDLSALFFGVVE